MRFFYHLLVMLFLISVLAMIKVKTTPIQKGGFYDSSINSSNELPDLTALPVTLPVALPAQRFNNERYLEHMTRVERPLTVAEKQRITEIAAAVNRNDTFVHQTKNVQENLRQSVNPDPLDMPEYSMENGSGYFPRQPQVQQPPQVQQQQPLVQFADPNVSQQVQLLLQPALKIQQGQQPHGVQGPPATEQQQVLAILSETEKNIDALKLSMDHSKNLLMTLSAKLQTTDLTTANAINGLLNCPVCPLSEPGLLNYTDVSSLNYR